MSTNIDEYNQFAFEFNINKLLVPTPIYNEDGEIISGEDPDVSVISGIFQSFSDAPYDDRGRAIYSTGVEYWYDQQFAVGWIFTNIHLKTSILHWVRFKYNVFGIDFSYLIPVQGRDEVNAVNLIKYVKICIDFRFSELKQVDN